MNKKFKTLVLLLSAAITINFVSTCGITATFAKNKKHCWTTYENDQLKSLVEKFGHDWERIAQNMPNINAKMCKEHYQRHLDPKINKSSFTKEEDAKLLELVPSFGSIWSALARKHFDGRTSYMLKNRYKILIRKQNKQERWCFLKNSEQQSQPYDKTEVSDAPFSWEDLDLNSQLDCFFEQL